MGGIGFGLFCLFEKGCNFGGVKYVLLTQRDDIELLMESSGEEDAKFFLLRGQIWSVYDY